ncbi:MAG: polysaccharide biosynthesis tyrosine autokinase [Chthoniobacterales bacterium]|nr:polysaccharide biosynthesis tyrosine autokinase [Chthoniobacterales bacterium]
MSRSLTPAREEPLIDFRHIYFSLREKTWLIAACTIAVCLIGAIYLWLAPPIYASRATIMVEQQESKVVNIQDVSQDDLKALEVMKTVEQSLTTDALTLRVAKINQLAADPNFLPQRAGETYSDDQLIRALNDRTNVRVRRGTRLIDITVESRAPALAKELAQSFIEEFTRQGYEQRINVAREANGFLVQEAERLKVKLETSERELQTYREANNAVSLEDKQNIVVETLKDLNLKLNDARTQRMKLESDFAQYKDLARGDPRALLVLSSIADSPTVLEAKKRVAEDEAQIAMLRLRYRAEHPKFLEAQSELAQVTADLNKTILKAGETIGSAYEVATVNEHKLEDALRAQEKLSLALNKIAIPYSGLEREVESDRALYQSILTRLKETDVTKALEKSPIRVVEPARVPSRPVRPNKLLVTLLCSLGGLLAGTSLSLFLQAIDSSLKTVDETERALGLTVVAAVPLLSDLNSLGAHRELPVLHDPDSPAAEAFRSLRTVLSLKEPGGLQVILCTSAAPGEGKTFCSLNCALALAQQGHRTLLVDADLRRPAIAKALGLNPHQAGLTEFLSRRRTLAGLIQSGGADNLDVLTAGPAMRNPAEQFNAATIARLLQDPQVANYDRVVFDSAPLHAVSDGLILVRHADVVCLVVRAAVTPVRVVQRAAALLTGAGAEEIAVVLNALPAHSRDSYYYYSADYARRTEEERETLAPAQRV